MAQCSYRSYSGYLDRSKGVVTWERPWSDGMTWATSGNQPGLCQGLQYPGSTARRVIVVSWCGIASCWGLGGGVAEGCTAWVHTRGAGVFLAVRSAGDRSTSTVAAPWMP